LTPCQPPLLPLFTLVACVCVAGTRWNIIKSAFEDAANVVFVKMVEAGKPKAGVADKKRGREEDKAGADVPAAPGTCLPKPLDNDAS
jgi:hypothetical protein